MEAAEWLKILASGGTSVILGAILWVLWTHHKAVLSEKRADETKSREEARASDKETLAVLASLTKAIETMPAANRELVREHVEKVLDSIDKAVEAINKHTDEHVRPGRKQTP